MSAMNNNKPSQRGRGRASRARVFTPTRTPGFNVQANLPISTNPKPARKEIDPDIIDDLEAVKDETSAEPNVFKAGTSSKTEGQESSLDKSLEEDLDYVPEMDETQPSTASVNSAKPNSQSPSNTGTGVAMAYDQLKTSPPQEGSTRKPIHSKYDSPQAQNSIKRFDGSSHTTNTKIPNTVTTKIRNDNETMNRTNAMKGPGNFEHGDGINSNKFEMQNQRIKRNSSTNSEEIPTNQESSSRGNPRIRQIADASSHLESTTPNRNPSKSTNVMASKSDGSYQKELPKQEPGNLVPKLRHLSTEPVNQKRSLSPKSRLKSERLANPQTESSEHQEIDASQNNQRIEASRSQETQPTSLYETKSKQESEFTIETPPIKMKRDLDKMMAFVEPPGFSQSRKLELVPWLEATVQKVISEFKDVSALVPKVSNLSSTASIGVMELRGYQKADSFNLSIPYAEEYLDWKLQYCWLDPDMPPEIDFDSNFSTVKPFDDEIDFSPVLYFPGSRESLWNYICAAQERLKKVYIAQARKHELLRKRLEGIEELSDYFEFRLFSKGERRGDFVAVYQGELKNISQKLPDFLYAEIKEQVDTENRAAEDFFVVFKSTSYGNYEAALSYRFSPFMEKFIRKFPTEPPALGMKTYCGFIKQFQKHIDTYISSIGKGYALRKRIIDGLTEKYTKDLLLEVDDSKWSKAAFILTDSGFKYILTAAMKEVFPLDAVHIQLRSIYHEFPEEKGSGSFSPSSAKDEGPFCTGFSPVVIRAKEANKSLDGLIGAIHKRQNDMLMNFRKTSVRDGI